MTPVYNPFTSNLNVAFVLALKEQGISIALANVVAYTNQQHRDPYVAYNLRRDQDLGYSAHYDMVPVGMDDLTAATYPRNGIVKARLSGWRGYSAFQIYVMEEGVKTPSGCDHLGNTFPTKFHTYEDPNMVQNVIQTLELAAIPK